jgi:uncharacterized protein
MKEVIKKIILENQVRIPGFEVFQRDYRPDMNANYIFTGQRRAGKTYFLYSLMLDALKTGMSPERILYLNFEDERLMEMNVHHLDAVMEAYRELYEQEPVLFFDEIQNIEGWQKFVRRMADNGYHIYVTGSNAEMLSSEMASTLGGRFMIMEIEPLTFNEFLSFRKIEIPSNVGISPKRFAIRKAFELWFRYGGFPELISLDLKKEYLSNLFQRVFLGDIITRHQIRNPFALKLMIKKLAESTMDEVSFNRIRNIINSTGIQVGTATVIEYLGFLKDSFLLCEHPNFNAKISSRESKKKYYFGDHGLLSLFLNEPEAFQLETLVFNSLRRRYGSNLFYLKYGYEVDFYVPGEELIQVCYRFQEFETRRRDISALMKASSEFSCKRVRIITYGDEETIHENKLEIFVIPAWKWILSNEIG